MKTKILLFLMLCFSACKNNVKLIYSPDKKYYLSQFIYNDNDGKSYTIFKYGKANNTCLPDSYIMVRNTWRDAWYGLITWNGEEAILYHTYRDFEAVNLDNSLLRMDEILSEQEFYSYFFNKIPNEYIKISSIEEYNTVQ